jgi:radical SAM superfamily enzyme YgiQ (UPF0313 family)
MAKKVLLISANTETFPMPVYPLSLARLAGAVEAAGHHARQFDVLVHGLESLPGTLEAFNPDLVALSLRNLDNIDAEDCYSYLEGYAHLMRLIRARTQVPVILGGSGFSLFPEEFMRHLGGDFGVIGPGEATLGSLLENLGEAPAPNGLQSRAQEPPATISRGLHDPELVAYYWESGGMIGLQTKRGCNRSCSYCVYPLIDGNHIQYAEVNGIVDELAGLVKEMHIDYFFLVDSIFNQNSEYELSFAEEIRRRGLKVKWGAFFSPLNIDRTYLETLKQSGLTHIEFGTDSLSEKMLRSYNKKFTLDEVMTSSAISRELGIHTAHYLLFGGPGETRDTVQETLRHAKRLGSCVFFPFAGVRILPGTGVFAEARRRKLVRERRDCFPPVFYTPAGLEIAAIWEIVKQETSGRSNWVLPSRYAAMAPRMRRLRKRGYKGPLWEYLLT